MNFHNATSKRKKRKKHQPQMPRQPELENQNRDTQHWAASLSQHDDLLTIEGIDPTTEMALNSIGIRRFADFARYTPETLAHVLQECTGLTVMAETIANEDWIGAAAICAAVTGKPSENHWLPEKTSQPTALPAEQISAAPTEEMLRAAAPENILTQNIANATVSDGTTDVVKNGSEILQTEQNEEKGNGVLWIQHAAFSPVEMPALPSRPATKFIRSEIIIGAEAATVGAEGTLFCARVHAVDTTTGEHKLLAAQAERLQPSQTEYPVHMEFAVPGVGRYRLHIIAFLLHPQAEIAFHQGPILRVVS